MYKKVITTTTEEYSDVPSNGTDMYGTAAMHTTNSNGNTNKNYAPCIRVDVPLMLRLLEYAREDASKDTDLHFLAAELAESSEDGRVLTMSDYDKLMTSVEEDKAEANNGMANTTPMM